MSASLQDATTPAAISEIEYHLITAEFDLLWGRARRPSTGESARMDYMISLIDAFEANRGKASFN